MDSEPKQKRKDLSQWTQAGKGYWGMMLDEHEARSESDRDKVVAKTLITSFSGQNETAPGER